MFMKFFHKKKEGDGKRPRMDLQAGPNTDDKQTEICVETLVPVDYEVSPIMADLEKELDSIAREFLDNTDPDKFNGSYLDPRIEAALKDTLADLEDQRVNHHHVIEFKINGMFSEKERSLEEHLADRIRELEETERDLSIQERILKRGTVYEDESLFPEKTMED